MVNCGIFDILFYIFKKIYCGRTIALSPINLITQGNKNHAVTFAPRSFHPGSSLERVAFCEYVCAYVRWPRGILFARCPRRDLTYAGIHAKNNALRPKLHAWNVAKSPFHLSSYKLRWCRNSHFQYRKCSGLCYAARKHGKRPNNNVYNCLSCV